jgi:hypothetical protein
VKDIPGVGTARGIFEIFVPGAFLLLNIIFVMYIWPTTGIQVKQFITTVASNSVLGIAVLVCFGYLLGVILRLLKTRAPDRWSGYFGWLISMLKRKNGNYFLEEFPYFTHIEKVAGSRLPEDAEKFYRDFWGLRATGGNREFFNYCKTMINAIDERSASEVFAAEALTRYIASMFYALLASLSLIGAAWIATSSRELLVLVCIYVLAIIIILWHLRFFYESKKLKQSSLLRYGIT